MKLNVDTGWLQGVKLKPSPHCSARPESNDISLIVVHSISLPPGEYGGSYIEQLFTDQLDVNAHPYFQTINTKVSAHVVIDRQGALTQYVSFDDMAWHAGVSTFEGREKCNEYSIGIELEGTDQDIFTDLQYQTLAKLIQILLKHFPKTTLERLVGHSDIAPGRKTDPGIGFDWEKLRQLL